MLMKKLTFRSPNSCALLCVIIIVEQFEPTAWFFFLSLSPSVCSFASGNARSIHDQKQSDGSKSATNADSLQLHLHVLIVEMLKHVIPTWVKAAQKARLHFVYVGYILLRRHLYRAHIRKHILIN